MAHDCIMRGTWTVDPDKMARVLQRCDEIYLVYPLYDDDGNVESRIIFPRLDIIANGLSDEGEVPDRKITKKEAKLLARLAIQPDLS